MGLTNALKRKLRSGRPAFGCIALLPSPDTTEILALAGFDYIFIDHEHGAGGLGNVADQLRAAAAGGATGLVRIPHLDPHYIRRLLDQGLQNVYCPVIESAEQAQALVRACRYPPRGTRGAGGGTRAALHGVGPDNPGGADDELMVIVAVETVQGVADLPRIAQVEGIDAIFIGARDLSGSLGRMGQFQDPELLRMIADSEAIIRASGKLLGAPVYPGSSIEEMIAKGYAMILTGTDTGFLSNAARASLGGHGRSD